MKFDDVVGKISVSSDDAKTFLKAWFKPEDTVVIVGRRSVKSGSLDTLSQSINAAEFISTLTDESLRELVVGSDGSMWNLYMGVSPVKGEISLKRRGTEDNVSYLPGVYADIDIKTGGFSSQEEILSFLDSLAAEPTLVVGSGSGGVHAYWRLNWEEEGFKELIERWWSYLDESAGDRGIDKLIDMTRILRIPGSVYFPKEKSDGLIGSVKLLRNSGKMYAPERLMDISKASYEVKQLKRAKTIEKEATLRYSVGGLVQDALAGISGNPWRMLRAASMIEDYVNNDKTWEEILSPHGWTFLRTLRDGSKEFARPGRNERSAVMDFEGSPVMSLLSRSEDTGLSDLLDARVPLTRYRVLLRLTYNDQESKMVEDLLDEITTFKG